MQKSFGRKHTITQKRHGRSPIGDRARMPVEPMLMLYGLDGRIVDANDAYCSYYAQSKGKMAGRSFVHSVPQEHIRRIGNALGGLTVSTPAGLVRHKVRHPNGEIREHMWLHMMRVGDKGAAAGYVAAGWDITESRDDVEALRAVERELVRALQRHTTDGSAPVIRHRTPPTSPYRRPEKR